MADKDDPIEIDDAGQVDEPDHAQAHKDSGSFKQRLVRFKTWYAERKKWTIPASVVLLAVILAGLPASRYTLASLVHKRDLAVRVLDATAGTPVSGATVSDGSVSAETSGAGVATLHNVKLGNQKLTVSKKYYKSQSYTVLSPIFKQKTVSDLKLTATGRRVKITVTNLINQKKLANVDIKVADITAKTDGNGSAIVVLPAGLSQAQAKLSLDNYNGATATVKVSDSQIQNNPFALTPAGKVYFLSKLSGKIDVVKTNLDGSDRQTVLAGTGKEDDSGTVLLASRDWKYLALLSKRAGGLPALYLIDTSDGSLTTMDSGNADFNLDGWAGDDFIYTVSRNDVQPWQVGGQVLKSYDAAEHQIVKLDQTSGQGTDDNDYVTENYNDIYIIGTTVFYSKTWVSAYSSQAQLASKKAGIYTIDASGKNGATLRNIDQTSGYTYISSVAYKTYQIYFRVTQSGSDDQYLEFNNGKLTDNSSIADDFNQYIQDPVTYLLSPSANNTFWAEPRDGKNTLFVGDINGNSGKQIATLSDYNTYGWYTDNYLLVSQNSSELYIMPKDGSNPPIKISDYHKPALTYNGYGGGYGGL